MTYHDGITSQEAFELASREFAQAHVATNVAVDGDGSIEISFAGASPKPYIVGNVVVGEAVRKRFGGDRIVRLTPDGMETVTDRLVLVEPVEKNENGATSDKV